MTPRISRIDPSTTVCWEDQHTLRFGFERARARLTSPSAAVQRLVSALRHGIPTAAIPAEARRAGATAQEARELLTRLRPVLLTGAQNAGPSRTPLSGNRGGAGDGADALRRIPLLGVIDDSGRPAPQLREQLIASGVLALDGGERGAMPPQLAIMVERFLEPLGRARRWSFEQVPQLLIRFTDESIRVGPILRPAGGPCHACLSLGMVARDPAYPAIAAQLHGVVPASETPVGTALAAAYAAALIERWRDGYADVHSSCIVVPSAVHRLRAFPRLEKVSVHEDCGCGSAELAHLAPAHLLHPAETVR